VSSSRFNLSSLFIRKPPFSARVLFNYVSPTRLPQLYAYIYIYIYRLYTVYMYMYIGYSERWLILDIHFTVGTSCERARPLAEKNAAARYHVLRRLISLHNEHRVYPY
jgi:hypothetical protein